MRNYIYYDLGSTIIERVRPDGTGQEELIDLSTDVDGGDPHQYILGITTDEDTGEIYITTRGGTDYVFPRLVRMNADGSGATVIYEWTQQEWRSSPFVSATDDRLLVTHGGELEVYRLSDMTLLQNQGVGNVIAVDSERVYSVSTCTGWPGMPALYIYDRPNLAGGPLEEIHLWRRTVRDGSNPRQGGGLVRGHLYVGQQDTQTRLGTASWQ